MSEQSYSADQIQVLEGLTAVRKRPAMYIGSTDSRGLHHLAFEVVSNSVDEALAGFCSTINMTLNADGSVTVKDDGRGIPVETHVQTGKSALEVVMTILHAGGKFDHKAYRVSGGLHGIGVSAVNALSEWLEVEVHVKGMAYRQRYERGVPVGPVQEVGIIEGHGTTVSFRPDPEIFEETKFDPKIIVARLRELAFLTNGLTVTFTDGRIALAKTRTFKYEGGLCAFIKYMNESKNVLHDDVVYVQGKKGEVQVELALQYTDDYTWSIHTFANHIATREGGTHLIGMKTAITRAINEYATGHELIDEEKIKIQGEDVREGLTAILSVKLPNPQFEGQTKTRLGNSELRGAVESILYDGLKTHFNEKPNVARAIVQRTAAAAKERMAAKEAKELVRKRSVLEGVTLPGKLADCEVHNDSNRTELFIVEGDSAGGCLTGDTEVRLVSGLVKTMKELAEDWQLGKQHFGYATDENGDIHIVPLIKPHLTKCVAQLVEVKLDNEKAVRCTPNHPFLLREGSYLPANQLQSGDNLMPLRTRLTREGELPAPGYEMVWMNGKQSWSHSHHLAFEKKIKPIRAGYRLKALLLLNHVFSSKNRRESYEKLRLQTDPRATSYDNLLQEYFNGDEQHMLEAAANINCKVLSVNVVNEAAAVYDLTVEHYHNFALSSGVFVHNSAKQARDRRTQAILPLRGKILNVEKHGFSRILDNNEIRALVTAIGTGIGDDLDVSRIRYGKIILLTDADVDGAHIRTLLLTFFYRHMPQLIETGRVYIAQPPLYRIRKGDRIFSAMDEKERKQIVDQELEGKADAVQRFKGLGEMNPKELWETSMNPATRTLLNVTVDDATEADKVFSTLMGDVVEPRRQFIQENADEVDWLDI